MSGASIFVYARRLLLNHEILLALFFMFADQLVFALRASTSSEWAPGIVAHFGDFLKDHAGAERKAHANCLAILAKYQNRLELVETMLEVAAEELQHFREVVGMLHERGLTLAETLIKDVYAERMLGQMRPTSEERLMDRLLIASIIEARGCERFGLLGAELLRSGDPKLGEYYTELSRVEARHYGTYLRLARLYAPATTVEARMNELLDVEASLIRDLPVRAALH